MRSPPHLPLGERHLGKIPSRLREFTSHQYQCLTCTQFKTHACRYTAQRNTRQKHKNPLSLICISPPSASLYLFFSHSTLLMYDHVMRCGTVTFHHFDICVGPQKYSPYVTVPVVRQTGPCKGKCDGCVRP